VVQTSTGAIDDHETRLVAARRWFLRDQLRRQLELEVSECRRGVHAMRVGGSRGHSLKLK
jgi:hypothetical protein